MPGIRFVGSGGQGVILAGLILGKAAAIYEGLETVFTESYGAETRGGFSSSSVIISDKKIEYPYVINPDILVAFSQAGYDAVSSSMKNDTFLIYESDLVKPTFQGRKEGIPATKISKDNFNNKTIFVNMIMLGFLVKNTNVVSKDSLIKAVEESVPKGTERDNIYAVELGYNFK